MEDETSFIAATVCHRQASTWGQDHASAQARRATPDLLLCRQVLFAPVQLGLIVVAASDDGCVHMFEADTVMSPREWTLQSKLQVGAPRVPGEGTLWPGSLQGLVNGSGLTPHCQ